jgi:hypothetical protein
MTSVAASVGVLGEPEMIPHSIAHLRAIGVSRIFVIVLGAGDDGTWDWLTANPAPDLEVSRYPEETPDRHLMAELGRIIRRANADWFMMLDADEFPLPRAGDIRAAFTGLAMDIVKIPRFNVVLGEAGPRIDLPPTMATYDKTYLYVKEASDFRARLKADDRMAWLPVVPLPKIAVRPGHLGTLGMGLHDASLTVGNGAKRVALDGLVIAHVPMSNYPRFAAKVANIEMTFSRHGEELAPNFGWHWRRWIDLKRAGKLEDEFDLSRATDEDIAVGLAQGQIATAATILASVTRPA